MDHCDSNKDRPCKIYVGQWPIFHDPLILPYIIVRLKLFLYIKKWHWPGGIRATQGTCSSYTMLQTAIPYWNWAETTRLTRPNQPILKLGQNDPGLKRPEFYVAVLAYT